LETSFYADEVARAVPHSIFWPGATLVGRAGVHHE
jgi:hypothetical protein